MGDWIYYVTLLPFAEISLRIKKTEEIHSSKLLRNMIQRALTPRSKNIAQYLASQPQRFFNAIVVGVYDGQPEWNQLSVQKSELFDPTALSTRVAESLGILSLRGDEKLFAIDGQHRVEGIKEFSQGVGGAGLRQLEDEVCAIFVSHRNDLDGMQRTRRLFATLNRYAKPVSLTEIIALDEDDVVAVTCRDLLERHSLFKNGRVSLAKGKAISVNDRKSFTSLPSLYQTMDTYLEEGSRSSWSAFKTVRPSPEETVSKFVEKAHDFWTRLVVAIPELKLVERLDPAENLPERFRGPNGGDLLFRAIAPPMIARCLRKAAKFGMKEDLFIKRLAKMPRSLNEVPWKGVLWDGSNMTIGEKNQKVAEDLILWMVNCDPKETKIRGAELKKRLALLQNKEEDDFELPAKLK